MLPVSRFIPTIKIIIYRIKVSQNSWFNVENTSTGRSRTRCMHSLSACCQYRGLFQFSKLSFIGSKYPKNSWFNVENKSTGRSRTRCMRSLSACCQCRGSSPQNIYISTIKIIIYRIKVSRNSWSNVENKSTGRSRTRCKRSLPACCQYRGTSTSLVAVVEEATLPVLLF